MRVYLPSTTAGLRELLAAGSLAAVPLTAFAVTPGLREWYLDDQEEDLEYAAMLEAARASLRLLEADRAADRRRVVVAAEVADAAVSVRDELDRGVVRVSEPVLLGQVVSVHADDAAAEGAVAAAATAIIAADLGDPAAQDTVDDAAGHELSWYASQEIEALLALM